MTAETEKDERRVSKVLPRILVVGVGGGGCHVVDCLANDWRDNFHGLVIDTDAQALSVCYCPDRFQIGSVATDGLSAGDDPVTGRRAAKEHLEDIRQFFENVDMVFLVQGLGGGTGTGAAPVIAEIARSLGVLVVALATLPFDFEGSQRRERALEGLAALRQVADAVVALPNQRLFDLIPDKTSLLSALQIVDKTMADYVRSLWRLLSQSGVMNLDFADIRNLVLNSGGTCALAWAESEGSHKVRDLLGRILRDPLFDGGQVIAKAPAILIGITGGPDMTLVEVRDVMEGFKGVLQPGAHIIMGAAVDWDWQDRMALTVLAAERYTGKDSVEGGGKAEAEGAEAAAKPLRKKRGDVDSCDNTPTGKGRFKDVEPTLYAGEDLDIPSFVRKGIKLPH